MIQTHHCITEACISPILQYNPKGAVWGNIVWAHSVSKDLINWESLEPAIFSKSFDAYGTWFGSATIVPDQTPVILYTGIVDSKQRQVQNFAAPKNASDLFIREWVKPDRCNPIIDPDSSVNASAFCDPTTAWFVDREWKILLKSRRKQTGVAYLYKSKGFKKWVKAKRPLHSVAHTGNFDSPDFFPVSTSSQNGLDTSVIRPNVKHVLNISLDETRYDYYTLGTYDSMRDKYIPDKGMVDGWEGLRIDYGNC